MSEHLAISTSAQERDPFNIKVLDAYSSLFCNLKVIPFSEVPGSMQRIEAADSVTIMGTPLSYSKKTAEQLVPYFAGLETAKVKRLLGICAGGQVLGLIFGAGMKRKQEVEIGPTTVRVEDGQEEDLLVKGLGKELVLDSLHTASLDISDAPKIINIARSVPTPGITETGCEAQIIKIDDDDRWIYGIQSHPEGLYDGLRIIRSFLDLPTDKAPVIKLPALQDGEAQLASGLIIPNVQSLAMAA